MREKIFAVGCAIACATALMAQPVFADDEVIQISGSQYLTDTVGTLEVSLEGEHSVEIIIDKVTAEGTFNYYDVTLDTVGTYDFPLDSCEKDTENGGYLSGFTFKMYITLSDGTVETYSTDSNVIYDPGFETGINSTKYVWNIEVTVADENSVAATDGETDTENGIYGDKEIEVHFTTLLGDATGDNVIDVNDAFLALQYSTNVSAGNTVTFADMGSMLGEKTALKATDVTLDGAATIEDAYSILMYSTSISAGLQPNWDDYR